MKLEFLISLEQLQPCGLRPVIDTLSDSFPVMAFSDWKSLATDLIDDGYVSRMGNGQYQVTPSGSDAIQKGQSFFSEITTDLEGSESKPIPAPKKPAPVQGDPITAPTTPQDKPVEAPSRKCEHQFIQLPIKNSSAALKAMPIDDLLKLLDIGREAESIIIARLEAYGFPSGGVQ